MKFTSFLRTDVGKVREENEDSIFSLPEHGLFVVADGMGGEIAGAEASAQVIRSVERVATKFFESGPPTSPSSLEETLIQSLQQANNDVFDISVKDSDKAGLGSTGSVLDLHRGAYFIAQVGDSRVYLVREGKVQQLTRDHTVVWALYESGVITRDQIETHPDRHFLTQCIGAPKSLQVDTFQGQTFPGDLFLICSDGLTGYAGESDVERILLEAGDDLKTSGDQLIEAALEGGGGDNISVILVRVESLDDEDTWTPEETGPSADLSLAVPFTEDQGPDTETHRRGRSPLPFIAIGVGVLAILGGIFALTRDKAFTARIQLLSASPTEFANKIDLPKADVRILNSAGEPFERLEMDEDRIFVFELDEGNKQYRVRISAPWMVEIDEVRIFEAGGEPVRFQPMVAGRLYISLPPESEVIAKLEIDRESGGDSQPKGWKPVYRFDKDDPGPGLDLAHDLVPDVRHRLYAESIHGDKQTRDIIIDAGDDQTERVVFP